MLFHGSYLSDDVSFLLKPIDMEETDIILKESFIQKGKKHYSEMISKEYEPSKEYMDIFHKIFNDNKHKMALDLIYLAELIHSNYKDFTLVSLARAGTPIGVLLKRILRDYYDVNANHYSISIIRDRGIDENALNYIIQNECDKRIIFLDGWTGKGVISKELKKWVSLFNEKYKTQIHSELFVLSDISGSADYSATTEDYLIPSAILNSTISGLVSRSILNDAFISSSDFHGCKFYSEFEKQDVSLWFVDELMSVVSKVINSKSEVPSENKDKSDLRKQSHNFIKETMTAYNVAHINYIKPGIGETTRVLLRRSPQVILLRDKNIPEVRHIVQLAREKNVVINEIPSLLYKAVGIIKNHSN